MTGRHGGQPMRMTIVRSRAAREKKSWRGPDLKRPLDPIGERQAAAMALVLMKHKVRRIISSPAIRCVQTMQPLADAADVPIELWDELGQRRQGDAAYGLLHRSRLSRRRAVHPRRSAPSTPAGRQRATDRPPRKAVQSPPADQRIGMAPGDHDQRTNLQARPPQADPVSKPSRGVSHNDAPTSHTAFTRPGNAARWRSRTADRSGACRQPGCAISGVLSRQALDIAEPRDRHRPCRAGLRRAPVGPK